jgi:hypothetical protein
VSGSPAHGLRPPERAAPQPQTYDPRPPTPNDPPPAGSADALGRPRPPAPLQSPGPGGGSGGSFGPGTAAAAAAADARRATPPVAPCLSSLSPSLHPLNRGASLSPCLSNSLATLAGPPPISVYLFLPLPSPFPLSTSPFLLSRPSHVPLATLTFRADDCRATRGGHADWRQCEANCKGRPP